MLKKYILEKVTHLNKISKSCLRKIINTAAKDGPEPAAPMVTIIPRVYNNLIIELTQVK